MRDWDVMMAGLLKLVPRAWVGNVTESVSEAHGVLEAFIRGQFVVMAAQALMYSFGLWLVGLNYAVILGLLAGVAALIPYARRSSAQKWLRLCSSTSRLSPSLL